MNFLNAKLLFVLFYLNLTGYCDLVFAGNNLKNLEKEIIKLIDSSKVSVVTVASQFNHEIYIEKESGILSFFKTEFQKQALSYINIGTGLVIDQSGHIITRSSVVGGADSNIITFANGEEVSADFIGHDPETGFAVLKLVEHENVQPAKLSHEKEIIPGQLIVMIGNSLGVFPSFDFGAINGVRDDGMIQVSTHLKPGNNGSPLFNFESEVIGLVAGPINVQNSLPESIFGYHYAETTLAYPITWIKRITEDIIEYGHVRKGWLGVVGYFDGRKPKIKEIKENSPAQQAGLIEGDEILKYGNQELNEMTDLIYLVENTTPGQIVPIEFDRGGQLLHVDIEIGEKSVQSDSLFEFMRTNPTINPFLNEARAPMIPPYPINLLERNQFLEMRVNNLEKEIELIKEMIEK